MLPVRASPYALVKIVNLPRDLNPISQRAQINHNHAFLSAKMKCTANINTESHFGLLLARAESNPTSHNPAFLFAGRE